VLDGGSFVLGTNTLDDNNFSPLLIEAAGSAESTLLITAAGDVDGAVISDAITADGLAVINQGTLSAVNGINETIVATSVAN
jgi:hypothetical protein